MKNWIFNLITALLCPCDIFAGNCLTGETAHRRLYTTNELKIECASEKLCDSLGWNYVIWAQYHDGKSMREHKKDFEEYFEKRGQILREKTKEWSKKATMDFKVVNV